ncbi:unnamed protein product [Adineta steineri]|uniref:non-specific serine/threonine protein kinase n=1 Tax=Adineta steineri TaxID=433720 RepID=A0A814KKV6_9BILA|nr:unnamed protein product [Adineta steineri]CAF1052177.1 unnamed protein product [Adineta steineri]
MRLKSHYHQITELLSSKSYKHRSSQGNYNHMKQETIPKIIKNRWSIQSPINSGSFGYIYQGTNLITNEKVAIKFESKTNSHPQLSRESQIYRSIEGIGIPKMYWYGTVDDNYHAIILEMLGPSIEDLYNYCHRRFTIKTVLLLGEQMLERICHIHRRSIIHRDIKPDNFTMGINSKCQNVYLIDFGLSKYYLNKKTRQHIEYNDKKHFLGTIRYASLRTHAGIEQSRRDDLESFAYTLIYLARLDKYLPWQGIKCRNKKEKQEKIYEIKLHTHMENLCLNLPKEFQELLIYTRQLGFAEEPNYFYIFSLIKQVYQTMNIKNDFIYDWIINKSIKKL